MAVIMNKENDKNSDISRRIDADLREKMMATEAGVEGNPDPDFAENSEYVKEVNKTGRFGWIWAVLVLVAVVVVVAAAIM